jgi:hypothetical protein
VHTCVKLSCRRFGITFSNERRRTSLIRAVPFSHCCRFLFPSAALSFSVDDALQHIVSNLRVCFCTVWRTRLFAALVATWLGALSLLAPLPTLSMMIRTGEGIPALALRRLLVFSSLLLLLLFLPQ